MPIRTVLFDVDGTLLDTREFVYSALHHTLTGNGIAVPPHSELAHLIGPPLETIYARLGSPADSPRMVEEHRSFQADNLHLSVAFEGAEAVLKQLAERGLRLAAVTSRSRRTSVTTLELAGLLSYLETVVSAEDAPALKPDPAHLRVALTRMRVGEAGVAMVGDTPVDVQAGMALGAFTVAALYGFHGPESRGGVPRRHHGRHRRTPGAAPVRLPPEILDLHVETLFKLDALGTMVANNTLTFEPAPRFYIGRAEGSVVALVRQDVPARIAADMLELASSEPAHTSPRTPPRFAGDYFEALAEDGPVERNYFGPAYWLPPEAVVSPPTEARLLTEADREAVAPHFAWLLQDLRAGQPVYGVLLDGAVVAQCGCSRLTERAAEAGVEVAEAYRGNGFAKDCARGWAREMRDRGLLTLWGTTWENEASQAIAAAVGFEPYGTDWHLA